MKKRVTAVIDLGSASTRLSIRSTNEAIGVDGVSNIRLQRTTKMGEGLTLRGTISPEALERVELVLWDYRQLCDKAGTHQVVVVATAAARLASNSKELAALVRRVFATDLRILSETEEGMLAFAGATKHLSEGSLALVIDIGGASTELIVGSAGSDQVEVRSVPIGAVGIAEEYLQSDPPDPAELSSALSVIYSHMDDVVRELSKVSLAVTKGTIIGVGGTIATTAAVELGLAEYRSDVIQGFQLGRGAVEDVFRTLATESHADRVYNPGLDSDRVSLIVGGLCVLVGFMRRLGIDEIVVSDDDLLEGIMADLRAG